MPKSQCSTRARAFSFRNCLSLLGLRFFLSAVIAIIALGFPDSLAVEPGAYPIEDATRDG